MLSLNAISQPSTPVSQLRNGCEIFTPWNPPLRSRDAISKGVSQLRNHPLAHKCHFAATKWAAKMMPKFLSLWNPRLLTAKSLVCCEKEQWPLVSLLNGINSIFPILNRHLNFKKVPRGSKPEHPPICLLRLSKPRASPTVFADTAMA